MAAVHEDRASVRSRILVAAGTTGLGLILLAAPASAATNPLLSAQLNSSLNQLSGINSSARLGLDPSLGGTTDQLTGIHPSSELGLDTTLSNPLNGLSSLRVTTVLRVLVAPSPTTTVPETTTTSHPQQD